MRCAPGGHWPRGSSAVVSGGCSACSVLFGDCEMLSREDFGLFALLMCPSRTNGCRVERANRFSDGQILLVSVGSIFGGVFA